MIQVCGLFSRCVTSPLLGATGVFRAAIDMAAAPQRGANPSFFLRYRYESGKAERATEELEGGLLTRPHSLWILL